MERRRQSSWCEAAVVPMPKIRHLTFVTTSGVLLCYMLWERSWLKLQATKSSKAKTSQSLKADLTPKRMSLLQVYMYVKPTTWCPEKA